MTDNYITFPPTKVLDVFASDELKNHTGEDEQEKREADIAATVEADQTMELAYGSHGVHKPHHFVGSISEIMKKLPPGLQISRVRTCSMYKFCCA